MESVWDKVKQGLKEGAAVSMERIEEYTRVGKLKLDEVAARRKIVRNFAVLGEAAFSLIEKGRASQVGSSAAVKKAVQNIKQLRRELEGIDTRVQQIQDDGKKSRTARAAAADEARASTD